MGWFVCVCVCHGGLRSAVLVCVITALSAQPKLSTVQFSSAQLSSAPPLKVKHLTRSPQAEEVAPTAGRCLGTAAPSGYDQCKIIIVLNIAALFVLANLLGGFTMDSCRWRP